MLHSLFTHLRDENSGYEDGIGKIIPDDVRDNPAKIAELLGASGHVENRPVYYKNRDGSFTKAPNRDVLVRSDNIFGSLQAELAAYDLKIAYGTSLKNGTSITVCAELPTEYGITVGKNDVLKPFLIVTQDTNSKHTSRASRGFIRTVSGATTSTTLDDSLIADIMKNMKAQVKEESQTFNLMYETEISNNELIKYFAGVMDVDPDDIGKVKAGTKLVSTKTENILKGITQSYMTAPGAMDVKGTVWGAWQAICYYATKLKTVRDTTDSGTEMARSASNLTGDARRLKVKGLDLALSYVTKDRKPARKARREKIAA